MFDQLPAKMQKGFGVQFSPFQTLLLIPAMKDAWSNPVKHWAGCFTRPVPDAGVDPSRFVGMNAPRDGSHDPVSTEYNARSKIRVVSKAKITYTG